MVVVQRTDYDDKNARLKGRLWSVDDQHFLREDKGEKFDLSVHDFETCMTASKTRTAWHKDSIHCYKCRGCGKAMAIIAVERLVPATLRCITRFNAVVDI